MGVPEHAHGHSARQPSLSHRQVVMTILILGFPHDVHIHAARWALDQVGADHQVLYTPDLPHSLRASVRMSADRPPTATFRNGAIRGLTGLYDTVWYRRSGHAM